MTSSDAGATSSSINSPTVPLPMPTLSPVPSLTRSPASTTSGNLIHRPFLHGLLRDNMRELQQEFDRLPTANIMLDGPMQMKLDVPDTINARVGLDISHELLKQGMSGQRQTVEESLRVSEEMIEVLYGHAFDVKA